MTISLTAALKAKKLDEFIEQEAARSIGPIDSEDIERAIKVLATQPLPEDQISHSTSHGGSHEK